MLGPNQIRVLKAYRVLLLGISHNYDYYSEMGVFLKNRGLFMIIIIPPATHHVQRVIVKEEEEGSGLVVECVFAEGSPQSTTCTVVVEGEGGQWVETFRGPLAFPHLPTGNYTVSVYDGEMGGGEPAVVTVAEVSGVPSSTPTFTGWWN